MIARYLEHIHFDSVCQELAGRVGQRELGVSRPERPARGAGVHPPPLKAHKKTPAGGWGGERVSRANQRPPGGWWTNRGTLANQPQGVIR